MVEAADVRRLAMAAPEATDASEGARLTFESGGKGFAWSYLERVGPRKPRVLRPDVLAVRCAIERKEMLIEAAPDTFFDDDHYRGYPAVLIRLAAIGEGDLAALLEGAWRMNTTARRRGRRP